MSSENGAGWISFGSEQGRDLVLRRGLSAALPLPLNGSAPTKANGKAGSGTSVSHELKQRIHPCSSLPNFSRRSNFEVTQCQALQGLLLQHRAEQYELPFYTESVTALLDFILFINARCGTASLSIKAQVGITGCIPSFCLVNQLP